MNRFGVVLFFASINCFGQDLEIDLGPPHSYKEAPGGTISFFNEAKRIAYSLYSMYDIKGRDNVKVNLIEDYSKFRGAVKEIQFEQDQGKSKLTFECVVEIAQKNYLIYSKFDKLDKIRYLYINDLSEDMILLGSPILIKSFGSADDKGDPIITTYSEDKKYILFSLLQNRKDENQTIECVVFNRQMDRIWEASIDIGKRNNEITVASILIDNNGNFYCLYYNHQNRKNVPILLSYQWYSKSIFREDLSDSKSDNYGFKLEIVNGTSPIIAGLYVMNDEIGYKIFELNPKTLTLKQLTNQTLSEEFQKRMKRGEFKLKYYGVESIEGMAEDIVVVVEGNYVVSSTGSNKTYCSGPLIVASYNRNGEKQFEYFIDKNQIQFLSNGSIGHKLFTDEINAYIIYNDNPENFGSKKVRDFRPYNGGKALTIKQVISRNGTKSEPLLKNHDEMLPMSAIKRISSKLYFITTVAYKPTTLRYGTLKLK